MKRIMIRLGLSLILAVSWGVQRLPAQTPAPPAGAPGTPAPSASAPALPPRSTAAPEAGCSSCGKGLTSSGPLQGVYQRCHACANKLGMGCSTNIDSPGCGNWRTHCVFAFGSCHAFFGESCNPFPQPATPRPQGTYEGYGR